MDFLWDIKILWRLLSGLENTLYISGIAIVFSIVGGFFVGFLMTTKSFIVRFVCKIYLETIRIIPIIVWLFLVYFGLGGYWEISAFGACIIVFSLWGVAESADLVRGAITSIPRHQYASASALGLSWIKIQIFIIIPQAILQLIPSSLNLFTRMVKTTALVSLIGVNDLFKIAQQIIETGSFEVHDIAFWVYGTIFLIYYFICLCLTYFGNLLKRKLDFRN